MAAKNGHDAVRLPVTPLPLPLPLPLPHLTAPPGFLPREYVKRLHDLALPELRSVGTGHVVPGPATATSSATDSDSATGGNSSLSGTSSSSASGGLRPTGRSSLRLSVLRNLKPASGRLYGPRASAGSRHGGASARVTGSGQVPGSSPVRRCHVAGDFPLDYEVWQCVRL